MFLNSGIQTYQILTNDDEVCMPSLSSILLAVVHFEKFGAAKCYLHQLHTRLIPDEVLPKRTIVQWSN